MKKLLIFHLLLLLLGCARIPVQSVELADAVQKEGERMHRLNLALLNSVFNEKRRALESVINGDYATSLIRNVLKLNPGITKEDFPELLQSITRALATKRDSLVTVLETEKARLTDKLNADFLAFTTAATGLSALLQSAAKIDAEKQALFTQVKTLSNNKVDFFRVENALNQFVQGAGNAGADVIKTKDEIDKLHNEISQLLK